MTQMIYGVNILYDTVLSVYMVMWLLLKLYISREHASQKPSKRYYEALNASYVHRMANFEQTKYTFKMTSQTEGGFQNSYWLANENTASIWNPLWAKST